MLMIKPESQTALQSVVCVWANLWGCALPSVRFIKRGVSSAHTPLNAERLDYLHSGPAPNPSPQNPFARVCLSELGGWG